ncbi:FtsW/RodA/SpoVE family cell cycle protein [Mariluticola halotolerans]|uniref:FtsW/RodA/SpoVE family cell cycle protein n=1 Tax=Mariluticola halotolerans TaxID=2909283 RepID=UPI0026E338FD|nr:putative peptidoglycan glycosyltransferase FtsW [Mariluticola halotolerans]UJQ94604.1 putative lipid II flippase FtsW [Mariluticola halotolerans]
MFSRARKTPLAEWWWTVDRQLLAGFVLLLMSGMLLSFAASPPVAERLGLSQWYFITRHMVFMPLALVVLIGTSFMTLRQVRLSALLVLVASMSLLAMTLVVGVEVKGATRWVSFFGQSIQPSEFVKPAFAVMAAWLFSEKARHGDMPTGSIVFGILATIVAMLLMQPDIGQTALIVGTWSALLFLSGISWWMISCLIGLASLGGVAAYLFFPHVARRIDAFLNPDAANGYQVEKALQSLLEGGWFGRGPGEAVAKRYLPDAHADFVFSAAAGEFGILFCMVLVGLIAFIVIRALSDAQAQSSYYARLAASALAIQFGLQSGINLAVNLNLMPPKGMTLPFVSYGGTSMLAVAYGMGMMLALIRKKPEERLATGLPVYRQPSHVEHA